MNHFKTQLTIYYLLSLLTILVAINSVLLTLYSVSSSCYSLLGMVGFVVVSTWSTDSYSFPCYIFLVSSVYLPFTCPVKHPPSMSFKERIYKQKSSVAQPRHRQYPVYSSGLSTSATPNLFASKLQKRQI